jgi:hypothetical protein
MFEGLGHIVEDFVEFNYDIGCRTILFSITLNKLPCERNDVIKCGADIGRKEEGGFVQYGVVLI